jgi:2'-phosphotransferase
MQIDQAHRPPRIRATQGHSVHLAAPILTPVTSSTDVLAAIHVTSSAAWVAIQADGFLKRMGRSYIHFATAPTLARANRWANVFLKLDVDAALAAGFDLLLSRNGVLLCEGPLPVEFVSPVTGFETCVDM